MNQEEVLKPVDTAEAMPQPSKKSPKRKWLIGVSAAVTCFALLVGTFCMVHRQRYGPVRKTIGEKSVDLTQLNYEMPDSPYIDLSDIVGMIDVDEVFHPTKQFGQTMSVHAKIVEILPDTYCFYDVFNRNTKTAYRILRLRVLDTIVGSNMPSQIYYLLPAYLSMDLMEYDSFIVTVRQLGVENHTMVNATQQTLEAFTLLFEPWSVDACWGSVMAFSDGVLDPSLWDKDGWNHVKDEVLSWIAPEGPERYPGKLGRNVKDTKTAILNARQLAEQEYWYGWLPRVVTTNTFWWKEARQELRYIRSEEGFRHIYLKQSPINFADAYVHACYVRYINGFETNEQIYITTLAFDLSDIPSVLKNGGVRREVDHFVRFTDEDLQNLPDLPDFVEKVKTFDPPKVEGAKGLMLRNMDAQYTKYKDYVFGEVSCTWKYEEDGQKRTLRLYHVIFPDGTHTEEGVREFYSTVEDWIAKQ